MLNIPRALLPRWWDTARVVGNLRTEILGRPIPVAAWRATSTRLCSGRRALRPGWSKTPTAPGASCS
jgi:glycerol kinase